MSVRLYLCPMSTQVRNGRTVSAPRVLQYIPGYWGFQTLRGSNVRNLVVVAVEISDLEHADAVADALITALPLPDELDLTAGDLSQAVRDAILARLNTERVPTDWITLAQPARVIIRWILRHLVCVQELQSDWPDVDLSQTVGTLPAALRNRLRTYAVTRGYDISDITNTTTVRALVRAFVERRTDWPAGHDRLRVVQADNSYTEITF